MGTLYYIPQYRTTTLNVAGGINDAVTTGIKLASIPADLDITLPGIICIDWADPLVTSTAEWITYTSIDGTNVLQGATRGQEGYTAKSHSNGAVIAFVASKSHINNINDKLTGRDATLVTDSNGNEIIKTASVASAVNELTVTNAATGNLPILSATGGDTNIGINLTPKGSGKVTVTANDVTIPTSANIQVNGADPKRGFYVPASAMISSTTNGAAYGQSETSTNKVNYVTYDFDQTTSESVQFGLPSPKYWDASTVTAVFYWTASSGSGTVTWSLQGMSFADDDALDQAFGTAQSVTDTLLATGDQHITSATSAITVGGTPTVGDWIHFKISRDVADTLSGDAKLMGVRIFFGIAQYDDQ